MLITEKDRAFMERTSGSVEKYYKTYATHARQKKDKILVVDNETGRQIIVLADPIAAFATDMKDINGFLLDMMARKKPPKVLWDSKQNPEDELALISANVRLDLN